MRPTVIEAIKEVMAAKCAPMTVHEVYAAVVRSGLYEFKADQPLNVVRSQIRRHCRGLDFPSASAVKHFQALRDGRYYLLQTSAESAAADVVDTAERAAKPWTRLDELRRLHEDYVADVRRRI